MLVLFLSNKLERKYGQLHSKEMKLILVGKIRSLVTILILQCGNHTDCRVSEQLQSHATIKFIKTIALKYF